MNLFTESNSILDDHTVLARRLRSEGYLFFPQLIPSKDIFCVRKKMLEVVHGAGWIDTTGGFSIESAISNSQAFVPDTHPVATAVMIPLPRVIPRTLFPNQDDHTTPPHQDYPHVQGSKQSCAAWIPLGDCGEDMGGLAIASGSHKDGILPIIPAMGAGGLGVFDRYQERWRYSPFNSGDVLIFNSLTVHKGVPNRSQSLRVSIDMRYQPANEPICEEWLKPHRDACSWQDIYRNWPDRRTQYYWQSYSMDVVPFDESYYDQREQKAFEMAASGDKAAIAALRRLHRIATAEGDEKLLRKANRALEELDS